MLTITYNITGAEEVRRELAGLRLDAVAAEVSDILRDMAKDAAAYPAAPPNSRYRRTDKLHDGWLDASPMIDLQGETLLATLTNPTPYGPFVQGAEDQAAIHQGRWKTVDALMDDWETRAAARIEDVLVQRIGI